MMVSRQEIHRVFHHFPQAARTCSKITSWTKVTCHPHFFKHHNMRERMLDANPYKCEDSHTPPKPSVPVKAVRTAQTLQSWEVKTSTSESADLCQHLCQLWFWDTQQSLPRLPLTAMPVLPFRGYEDSLEVDIVEVPARGHLRLIALKLFDEQLINQTLEIWFHEIIILFCFLFGRISNPWDR